jgi:hypothetical protein
MNLIYEYEVELESKEGQKLLIFIKTLNQKKLKEKIDEKLKKMSEYEMYNYKIRNIKLNNKKLFNLTELEDLTELFNVSSIIHEKKDNFSLKEIQKSLLKIKQGFTLELAQTFNSLELNKILWFKLNNSYDFDNKLKNNIGFVKKITSIRYTGEFEGIIIDSLFKEQMFDLNEILPINKEELSVLENKIGYKINSNEILTESKYIKIKKYLEFLNKNYLDDFSDIDEYLV